MITYTTYPGTVSFNGKDIRFTHAKMGNGGYKIYSDDEAFAEIIGTGGFTNNDPSKPSFIEIGGRFERYLKGEGIVLANVILSKIIKG